jgi:glycosyltransferase involved in cell wall biosynthesis
MLAKQEPRLIQTFLFHANIVGRFAGYWAGVPHIVSGIRVAERQRRWRLWADRITDRLVDRHVCVSNSVARFASDEVGLPAEKLAVIANGVDLERFPASQPAEPSWLGIQAGRQAVVFIGRLDRQKGVLWLLDMAAQWMPRLPNVDLFMVGSGPLHERLRAKCQRLAISERVHFLGWRPDIPEILAASRLLVLPSQWEGMPNVALEAMASRLPLVASDVEGVRELLGPNADAQTVAPGDSHGFMEKVVMFLNDRAAADAVGHENRLRVEQHFSLGHMVSAYESLWESIVAGGD